MFDDRTSMLIYNFLKTNARLTENNPTANLHNPFHPRKMKFGIVILEKRVI